MSQDKDGGYCSKCDTVWASPGKCRCDEALLKSLARPGDLGAEMGMPPIVMNEQEKALVQNWQYDKEARTVRHIKTWNAAIEAAALDVPKYEDDNMNDIRESIRKLKK